MSNKNIKSITAPSFQTFVSILREEQKKQYMLVKFDYKNGYFCGVLSGDNNIPNSYHEALSAINPESKELVLRQIMSLVVAATGDNVPKYELDDVPLTEEQIAQIKELSTVSDLPESRITKRLFEVAKEKGAELEPVGKLAGVRKQTTQRSQRNKK